MVFAYFLHEQKVGRPGANPPLFASFVKEKKWQGSALRILKGNTIYYEKTGQALCPPCFFVLGLDLLHPEGFNNIARPTKAMLLQEPRI